MARVGKDSWLITPVSFINGHLDSETELHMRIDKEEASELSQGEICVNIIDADNDDTIIYITPQTALQIVRDMLEILAHCREAEAPD